MRRVFPIPPTALLVLFVAALCCVSCSDEAVEGSPGAQTVLWDAPQRDTAMAGYLEDRPWLLDVSPWFTYVDADGCVSGHGQKGAFAVGNGRVFTLAGLARTLNAMHGMIGPGYQRGDRFFGDVALGFRVGGEPLDFEEQWMWRTRSAPIVVSKSTARGLELFSIDFAPRDSEACDGPSCRAIVRIAVIRNATGAAVEDLSLHTRTAVSTHIEGERLVQTLACRRMSCGAVGGGIPLHGSVEIPVGRLEDGEEAVRALSFVTSFHGEGEAETIEAIEAIGVDALLAETWQWWADWLDDTTRIDTPDPMVNDLIDTAKLTIKAQQTVHGATSPMSRYTRTWTRDTVGPVYYLLDVGAFDDVRAMLDFHYAATLWSGDLKNSYSLDHDVESPPPPPDWETMPPFQGRTAAEVPSFVPLMYERYYRHTGDLEPVEDRYGFLRRCILAQGMTADGLFPFSGDETYRDVMKAGFGLPLQMLFTDDHLSANSSFLFTAAAESMASLAEALGETGDAALFAALADEARAAADEHYWLDDEGFYAPYLCKESLAPVRRPFEDVSTQPLWTGYHAGDNPGAVENLLNVMGAIGNGDARLQTPLAEQYQGLLGIPIYEGLFTGMAHGFYLYNLAAVGHPEAEAAFNQYRWIASTSGNFSEIHVADDLSAFHLIYDPFGVNGDLSARFRPWEGGITLDALWAYLTGIEVDVPKQRISLCPSLPNNWPFLEAFDVHAGDGRFDLRVDETATSKTIVLVNTGTVGLRFETGISVKGSIAEVRVNGERRAFSNEDIRTRWGISRLMLPVEKLGPGEDLRIDASITSR